MPGGELEPFEKLSPRFSGPVFRAPSPLPTGRPLPPSNLVVQPNTERLRLVSFNTHLVPGSGYDGAWATVPIDSWAVEEHAAEIAQRILLHKDAYDVIVLNEVFDGDALDILISALKAEFPHYIADFEGARSLGYLPSPIPFSLPDILPSFVPDPYASAGLAIFSRFKFQDIGPGNHGFSATGSVDVEKKAVYEDFDAYAGSDGLAHKGVAIVRIERDGRLYTIAFTHLQADYPASGEYYPEVRAKQLAQIRALLERTVDFTVKKQDILLVGDLNIEGWIDFPPFRGSTAARPNPAMAASEYGRGIWGQLDVLGGLGASVPGGLPVDGLPFYDTWRTTSPEDQGITHFLPTEETGRLDYALLYGGGYYVAGAPSLSETHFYSSEVHDRQCPQWLHSALKGAPSDHVGVFLELGPIGPACRPDLAIVPRFTPAQPEFSDPVQLAKPGQVKWYRVNQPGTYSIGFRRGTNPQGHLAVDVFAAHDLARSIVSVPDVPDRTVDHGLGCRDARHFACVFDTKTYFVDKGPFYVRVYAPSGRVTGSTELFIRKNQCSSVEDGCWMAPGDGLREYDGHPTQDEFFLQFRTYRSFNNVPQDCVASYHSDGPGMISGASYGRVPDDGGGPSGGTAWWSDMGPDTYVLRVRRVDRSVPIRAGWDTTLWYLEPQSIYCADETGMDAFQNDEILAEVGVGGDVYYRQFWPDVNAGDGFRFSKISLEMPGYRLVESPPVQMPVVGHAEITVAELVGESLDPPDRDQNLIVRIPPLTTRLAPGPSLEWLVTTELPDSDGDPLVDLGDWATRMYAAAPGAPLQPSLNYVGPIGAGAGVYQLKFRQVRSPGGGKP